LDNAIAPPAIDNRSISKREWAIVLALCAAASAAAVLVSWRLGALLNYGDAVAHLHIARRVFDCHQPRFSQLGSVWLPLPHILLLPFVQVYSWWANGLAGVLPSALAYVAACAGIYRLARHWLPPFPAAFALAFFATNPNLLYLQTTAMTEPLFLCEMIWITVWLIEWHTQLAVARVSNNRLVWMIALALVAAIFTRYDGWIIALLAWIAMAITLLRAAKLAPRTFWLASALVAAAPVAWFAYNSGAFNDWLFFARGPYSAKAIEIRTAAPGFPPHPGWHNPWVAFLFYMKAAEMDAAPIPLGNALLALCLLGAAWAARTARRLQLAWVLLLVVPVPFYTYSVAYGSVPIFLPAWWPHSWYNLRYGLELLPALALFSGFAAQFFLDPVRVLAQRKSQSRRIIGTAAALSIFLAYNALEMLRQTPQVYEEGVKNIEAHRPYQREIPPILRAFAASHPGAVVLMDTSVDPEIVALSGIPLRQTINESDLQIYRNALQAPSAHAQLVIAYDGDEIDDAVHAHPAGLSVLRRFTAPYQPSITLYISDTSRPVALNKPTAAVIASLREPR
jgi:hypothetical protein